MDDAGADAREALHEQELVDRAEGHPAVEGGLLRTGRVVLDRDVREVLPVIAEGEVVRNPRHDLLGGHDPLDRVGLHAAAVERDRLVALGGPEVGDLGVEVAGDHVGERADLREEAGPAEVEAARARVIGAEHVERGAQRGQAGHRGHLRLDGRLTHREVRGRVVGHGHLPEHDVVEVADQDQVVPVRDGDLPLAVEDTAEGAEQSCVVGVEDEDVGAGDRVARAGRHVERQGVELVRRVVGLGRGTGQRDPLDAAQGRRQRGRQRLARVVGRRGGGAATDASARGRRPHLEPRQGAGCGALGERHREWHAAVTRQRGDVEDRGVEAPADRRREPRDDPGVAPGVEELDAVPVVRRPHGQRCRRPARGAVPDQDAIAGQEGHHLRPAAREPMCTGARRTGRSGGDRRARVRRRRRSGDQGSGQSRRGGGGQGARAQTRACAGSHVMPFPKMKTLRGFNT